MTCLLTVHYQHYAFADRGWYAIGCYAQVGSHMQAIYSCDVEHGTLHTCNWKQIWRTYWADGHRSTWCASNIKPPPHPWVKMSKLVIARLSVCLHSISLFPSRYILYVRCACAPTQNDLINFYLWPGKGSYTWLTYYKHDTKLNCPKSVQEYWNILFVTSVVRYFLMHSQQKNIFYWCCWNFETRKFIDNFVIILIYYNKIYYVM